MAAPSSTRSRGESVFTLPAVPTGMNTGVSMIPRGVSRRPRRAAPSSARSWKRITAPFPHGPGALSRGAPRSDGADVPPRRLLEEGAPGTTTAPLGDDAESQVLLERVARGPADHGVRGRGEEAVGEAQRQEFTRSWRVVAGPDDGASTLGEGE